MAQFRFATDGFRTVLELDGKTIGTGVEKVEFLHEVGKDLKLKLDIDVDRFSFLPDGAFDEKESVLMGTSHQHTAGLHHIITAK